MAVTSPFPALWTHGVMDSLTIARHAAAVACISKHPVYEKARYLLEQKACYGLQGTDVHTIRV